MSLLMLAAFFLAAAAFFAPLAKRAGFSSIIGYLGAGILIGPSGFGLIYSNDQVDEILGIAEFGVVLLLFLIGLELRPQRLWALRTDIFGAGLAQVVLSTTIFCIIGMVMGLEAWQAFIVGGALALSSTAFVLQFLGEKGQLSQRHGRLGFSVLLFQDLAAIPLIAFIPFLSTAPDAKPLTLIDLGIMVATVGLVLIVGRYVLRYVYRFVAATGVEEGMTAAGLLTVVVVTLLMDYVGLSAALGAFLAGMLIGGSEYRHDIKANIAPFERILLGVFFIAVGMALDISLLIGDPARILILALGILTVKTAVLFGVGLWQGLGIRKSLLLGTALAQGGEFAFVVFGVALQNGLLSNNIESELAVAVTISIVLTPIAFWLASRLGDLAEAGPMQDMEMPDQGEGHVIVAGFGPFGQIPSRVLAARNIPFTAIENRAEYIGFLRRFGADVYYGDVTRPELLAAAGADRARAILLALEDAAQNTEAAQTIRRLYPDLPIYARARDRFHAYELLDLGVETVMRETYHSSLELTEALLVGLGEAPARARRDIQLFRAQDERRFAYDRPHHTDEEKVRDSARRAREELERQFIRDREDTVAEETTANR